MKPQQNDAINELESRLSGELRSSARSIAFSGDPTLAVARSDQRRQRRAIAGVAAGLVAAGGLTVGALSLRPESQTELVAADGGDQSPVGADLPLVVDWRTVDAAVDWPTASFVGADGYRYALSTAPGTRFAASDPQVATPVPQSIYRTNDGEHWETIDQSGPRLGGLSSRDGVLYSVSTSTDASGGAVSQVLRSDDNGAAWSVVELALGFTQVVDPNELLIPLGTPSLSLTVGDDQMIASGMSYRWFDDQKLAAFLGVSSETVYSEFVEDANNGDKVVIRDYAECEAERMEQEAASPSTTAPPMAASGTGTADADPCSDPVVVAEASLAQLGIEGDLLQQRSVVSADGVTWTPVEVPGSQLWYAGGVFVATDFDQVGQGSFFRSTDGTAWTPMVIEAADSLEIVGTSNGILVGRVARGETSAVTVSSDGGETWRTVSLDELVPGAADTSYIASAAAGDLGIVVVVGTDTGNGNRPMTWTTATSGDGTRWATQAVADVADIGNGYPSWAFVDSDRIGVVFSGAKRNDDGSVAAVTLLGTPTR